MKEYNTAEIRGAAAKLEKISTELKELRRRNIKQLSATAQQLEGETGEALRESSLTFENEINRIHKIIDSCSGELYAFARRLDLADQQIAESIK